MKLDELRKLEKDATKGSAWERDSTLVRISPLLLDLWEAAEKSMDEVCSSEFDDIRKALAALEAAK